jgi:hypothetical protein
MKLRKQATAKAFIVAATAGLLVAFFGLIKAEPRLKAEAETPVPARDFERFFAPAAPDTPPATPAVLSTPHTRTRGS